MLLLCGGVPEHVLPDLFCDVGVLSVGGETAGFPGAAQVYVAFFLDEGEVEGGEGDGVGVRGRVRVPGCPPAVFVRVDEGDGGGKGFVVVDYVG